MRDENAIEGCLLSIMHKGARMARQLYRTGLEAPLTTILGTPKWRGNTAIHMQCLSRTAVTAGVS
jgi:hypothetical protein